MFLDLTPIKFSVSSADPVAIYYPLSEKATHNTIPNSYINLKKLLNFLCIFVNVCKIFLDFASINLTVKSSEAVASC
jgi:hypothetical protein